MTFTEFSTKNSVSGVYVAKNVHELMEKAWNAALEEALYLCQGKFEKRAAGGFVREAATARALKEEIAMLKA